MQLASSASTSSLASSSRRAAAYTVNDNGNGGGGAAASSSHRSGESCWMSLLLPTLPVLLAALLCLPAPLLHLTHALRPVPDKQICADDAAPHVTYQSCLLILGYAVPALLTFFLVCGLVLR